MAEPLWKLRKRKGLSINQLAAKSGVPAISIREYESGHPIRAADLPKLAKALYVEEWDIELESKQTKGAKAKKPRAREAKPPRKPSPPSPARAGQITHLINLVRAQFGKDRAALEAEIGKPMEQLTRPEASALLKHYQQLIVESRPAQTPDQTSSKRRRAYLPEGVDAFEMHYLTTQQEKNALIRFTLFDGNRISGRILGFSPYSITIREEGSEDEVTLQKLAIAYYRIAPSEEGEP